MRVDLHQHVWTEPLLAALAARDRRPYVDRRDGLCVLHAAGELPSVIDAAGETADRRIASLRADGVDLAVVALSSPIGIESLPGAEAAELIDAHLEGVDELGPRFAAWGPIAVRDPDPGAVDARLDRGCVGISLPATALADRSDLAALMGVLERAGEREAPVFVHPGPPAREPSLGDPLWWSALTDYVAQMQAAWLNVACVVRRELPRLRVVFAMLAGLAPTLAERLAARGGPAIDLRDPHSFYETSSHGPAAVETMARRLGPDRLVYGSDRPVIEPVQTGREMELMENAALLFAAGARL